MYRISRNIFFVISAIFFAMTVVLPFVYIANHNLTNLYMPQIVYILFFLIIVFFSIKKNKDEKFIINERKFLLIVIAFSVFLRLIEVYLFQTIPESDFKVGYNAAKMMFNGDFSLGIDKASYYYRYNFLLGHAFYEFLVLKIFNSVNLFLLKGFNILWTTLMLIFIYKLAKKIFGEIEARISIIMMALYIPHIFSTSVLTNQHLSILLFIIALYYVVKQEDNKFNYLLAGFFAGLGQVIKPLGPFYVTAIILFILLNGSYHKLNIKKLLLRSTSVLAVFFTVVLLMSTLFISLGMTTRLLTSNVMPYWPTLAGTDYETSGCAIGTYEKQYFNKIYDEWNADYDKASKIAKDKIIERVLDGFPGKISGLLFTKFKNLWGNPDSLITWSVRGQESEMIFNRYMQGNTLIFTSLIQLAIIYFFGLIAMLFQLISKNKNHKSLLLAILLSGYAFGLLLIAVQTRYRYEIFPILIILSSFGMSQAITWSKCGYEKLKNTNFILRYKDFRINTIYPKYKMVLISLLLIIAITGAMYILKSYQGFGPYINNITITRVDNSKVIFTPYIFGTVSQDKYAWYVYKDGTAIEKNKYTENKTLVKNFSEPGSYKVKLFIKNPGGKVVATGYSEEFTINKDDLNEVVK